jgi:hypothetical protein
MFDIYTFYPLRGTNCTSERDKNHKESKINFMFIYKETAYNIAAYNIAAYNIAAHNIAAYNIAAHNIAA